MVSVLDKDLYEQTLADHGYAVGDLVTYINVKDSTGGIVFRIIDDVRPVKPHATSRKTVKKYKEWQRSGAWTGAFTGTPATGKYVEVDREVTEHGAWDENGKKIMVAATHGFIRIKPIFEFFATPKGKNPRGKGNTIIIEYSWIRTALVKVDLVILGSKYVELGNIIHNIARKEGMDETTNHHHEVEKAIG